MVAGEVTALAVPLGVCPPLLCLRSLYLVSHFFVVIIHKERYGLLGNLAA